MPTHQLIQRGRGKERVVAQGSYGEMRKRQTQFVTSQRKGVSGRGGKKYSATYRIEEIRHAEEKEEMASV